MDLKHTPGPWRWELNESSRYIQLCGGIPAFDKTVMDFVRYGAQGAKPRFLDKEIKDHDKYNILKDANEYGEIVKGREHHARWFKDINHPDAKLIAAAPTILKALISITLSIKAHPNYTGEENDEWTDLVENAVAAINLATYNDKSLPF